METRTAEHFCAGLKSEPVFIKDNFLHVWMPDGTDTMRLLVLYCPWCGVHLGTAKAMKLAEMNVLPAGHVERFEPEWNRVETAVDLCLRCGKPTEGGDHCSQCNEDLRTL